MGMSLNLEYTQQPGTKEFEISLFSEAILLSKDENVAREDRRLLRRTGFKEAHSFASGVDAIQSIVRKRSQDVSYTCFVLCYEFALTDMEVSAFISLLRLHPESFDVPVFIILSSEKLMTQGISPIIQKEKYMSLGATGIFVSPITPNKIYEYAKMSYFAMQNAEKRRRNTLIALSKATEELKIHFFATQQEKINIFDKAMLPFIFQSPENLSYEDAYMLACEKLSKKLYEQASKYFNRAMAPQSSYKAAALFGMYQLYREKQDTINAKIYLMQSFQAFIDGELWEWVEECAMRFCKDFPYSPHPILGLITTAIKRNDLTQLTYLINISSQYLKDYEVASSVIKGCFHYELSPAIMHILQQDTGLYREVVMLLEERLQERNARANEISPISGHLQSEEKSAINYETSLADYYSDSTLANVFGTMSEVKESFDNFLNPLNDIPINEDYLKGVAKKEFVLSNSVADRENHMKKDSQNVLLHLKPKKKFSLVDEDPISLHEHVEELEALSLEPLDLEKKKTPLGAASKGFIDSLPLVVLDERHKGSLWTDIVNIAKQTARAYKRVNK